MREWLVEVGARLCAAAMGVNEALRQKEPARGEQVSDGR